MHAGYWARLVRCPYLPNQFFGSPERFGFHLLNYQLLASQYALMKNECELRASSRLTHELAASVGIESNVA